MQYYRSGTNWIWRRKLRIMLRKMERILLPMRTQVCHDTQHIIQNRSIPADHSALPSSCSEEISGCPDIQSSLFRPLGNDADCGQAPMVPVQTSPASERGRGPDRDRSENLHALRRIWPGLLSDRAYAKACRDVRCPC